MGEGGVIPPSPLSCEGQTMNTRMLRWLTIVLLLFTLAPTSAFAQGGFVRLQSKSVNGVIDAVTDELVIRAQDVGGFGSIKIQTLDSYTGDWEVQCALDSDLTWDTDNELALTLVDSTSTVYSVSNVVGIYTVGNASGCYAVRVAPTGGFSGTDTHFYMTATQTGGAGSSGGGGGAGTSDTTEATQLLVLAAVDGLETNTADLDANTDGIEALLTTIDADTGNIATAIASLLTSSQLIDDTIFADSAAFTVATSKVQAMGCVYQATPATLVDGDIGAPLCDSAYLLQVGGSILTAINTNIQALDNIVSTGSAVPSVASYAGINVGGNLVAPTGSTEGSRTGIDSILIDPDTNSPVSYAGCTPGSIISDASDNDEETEIKSTAGRLYWVTITSLDATPVYVKFYDLTAANTSSASTPTLRIGVPANATASLLAGHTFSFPNGAVFSTAMTFRAVTELADNGTTDVTSAEVLINYCYV